MKACGVDAERQMFGETIVILIKPSPELEGNISALGVSLVAHLVVSTMEVFIESMQDLSVVCEEFINSSHR